MATKLTTPVTRESTLRLRSRAVEFTLSPATAPDLVKVQPGRPEHLMIHLKGTKQRLYIPLEEIVRIMQRRGEL